MGGAAAVDFALARPSRVSALVAVGPGLSGFSFRAYSDEQSARAKAAWEARELETLADIWLEVWAPLGADEPLRTIAHENAMVFRVPEEIAPDPPAAGRLGELTVPTLVVVGDHEHPGIREICDLIAAGVPGARLELLADADHLPAYRQPRRFNELVLGSLDPAS